MNKRNLIIGAAALLFLFLRKKDNSVESENKEQEKNNDVIEPVLDKINEKVEEVLEDVVEEVLEDVKKDKEVRKEKKVNPLSTTGNFVKSETGTGSAGTVEIMKKEKQNSLSTEKKVDKEDAILNALNEIRTELAKRKEPSVTPETVPAPLPDVHNVPDVPAPPYYGDTVPPVSENTPGSVFEFEEALREALGINPENVVFDADKDTRTLMPDYASLEAETVRLWLEGALNTRQSHYMAQVLGFISEKRSFVQRDLTFASYTEYDKKLMISLVDYMEKVLAVFTGTGKFKVTHITGSYGMPSEVYEYVA